MEKEKYEKTMKELKAKLIAKGISEKWIEEHLEIINTIITEKKEG